MYSIGEEAHMAERRLEIPPSAIYISGTYGMGLRSPGPTGIDCRVVSSRELSHEASGNRDYKLIKAASSGCKGTPICGQSRAGPMIISSCFPNRAFRQITTRQ